MTWNSILSFYFLLYDDYYVFSLSAYILAIVLSPSDIYSDSQKVVEKRHLVSVVCALNLQSDSVRFFNLVLQELLATD